MQRLFVRLLTLVLFALPAIADPCPSVRYTLEQTLTGYGGFIEALETIDYDHDGKLDLVGAIQDDNGGFATLHSWRGKGDGTFEAAVSLGDTQILDLQVVNVNGDNYDDLVGGSYNNRFWVRLGNATGFDPAIVTFTNYAVYDIHAGNFNEGNGNIDLVTSSLTSSIFVVYQGNGDGTFTETRRVSVGSGDWVTGSIAGDFDNDGRIDVALVRDVTRTAKVYFRNADGTYPSTPVSLPAGEGPEGMGTGDFNEDGLLDFTAVHWEDGTIHVYLNSGARAFAPLVLDGSFPGDPGGLVAVRVVDINADANLDILAGSINGNWIAIYLGNGNGTFNSANWFTIPEDAFSIAVGNFDGATDADLELAAGGFQKFFTGDYGCATQVVLYSVSPMISTGQTAKFRAVVSGIGAGTPLPRGTVTFKEGATTLGTGDVAANGTASLDYQGLGAGNHTITAEFGGNSVIGAGTSAAYVQKVTSGTSTTTITLGASTHGEPFHSTVNVTTQHGFDTEGEYYLTLDGVTETTRRWSGAPLTLTLSAGPHSISAEYLGNTFDPPSTSQTYHFVTAKHAVSIAKSGDTSVRLGVSHNVQINVSATTSPAPTGSVELFRGTTSVGSVALSGGVASFYLTLPRGSYDYTATYSGDSNYLGGSVAFPLNTMANTPLYIDAYATASTIMVPAVVPNGTTAATLYRRVSGSQNWTAVPSWSLGSQVDDGSGLTRGVLYDYRLDATVSGNLQQSNIDSALLFTDPALTTATVVKLAHFTELLQSINALRSMAGLTPAALDGSLTANGIVSASHLTGLRNAAAEARTALGMLGPTFTDPSPAGASVKRAHVTELREAGR